jgi:hypothetical protein
MKKGARNGLLLVSVLVAILGFIYLITPRDEVRSQVDAQIVAEKSRFTPAKSVDIAMAMGLLTHDPPQMLNPPQQGPPLLLYPPSEETLARMTGE